MSAPPQVQPEAPPGAERSGSRRRRVWELGTHAHCPVVGVCLPMPALRRLVNKVLGGQAVADDYALHCGVVAECTKRGRLSEAVQRELDQRHALALQQAAGCKTTEALGRWWAEGLSGTDVAGAFWATLTHARCDGGLEEQVLRDIHMLQHQMGAAGRADLQRLHALLDENAVLARELGAAQQRSARVAAEQALKIEHLQSQLLRLRGELLGRDTLVAQWRDTAQALEQAAPDLKPRLELTRQSERQLARIHDLERQLLRTQHLLERAERRAASAAATALAADPVDAATSDAAAPSLAAETTTLSHQAVLCVGGRQASVPVYRRLVEDTGGRFLHHDGGQTDSAASLDATLAAADLVICQAGCISHDAYWRVKEHCKRTGKPCVFVDKPSRSGLARALQSLALPLGGQEARLL